MEKIKQFFIEHKKIILLILTIFILSSTMMIRYYHQQPLLFEQESYYHLNKINEYNLNQINFFELSPLEMILQVTGNIIPVEKFYFIPLILCVGSLLIYFRLEKLFFQKNNQLFNLILPLTLILTPNIILTFTTLTENSFILFIGLLSFYFLNQEKEWIKYLAIPTLFFIPFFNIYVGLLFLILLIWKHINSFKNKILTRKFDFEKEIEKMNHSLKTSILTIIISITISIFYFKKNIFSDISIQKHFFGNIISDLGAISGISIFILFMAILGIIFYWNKKESKLLYLLLIITTIGYFFDDTNLFYLIIVLVFFSSKFMNYLFEREWNLEIIKKHMILLIILGIIFSTISFQDRIEHFSPSKESISILSQLNEQLSETATDLQKIKILSINDNQEYIKYFIKNIGFYNDDELFSITYPKELFPKLESESIEYIYIDPLVKNKFQKNQGLFFALRNEKFKMLYSENGYEIWQFNILNEKKEFNKQKIMKTNY